VRPCATADGRGAPDAALRDIPALPEPAPSRGSPAPRVLQGSLMPTPAANTIDRYAGSPAFGRPPVRYRLGRDDDRPPYSAASR
jgi:hypothetical protein